MMARVTRRTQLLIVLTMLLLGRMVERNASDRRSRDRGDVPGWVMITVMTAIVVVGLLVVFQKQVVDAVNNAFNSVRDSGGN